MDIAWLKDESAGHGDELPAPEMIAGEIVEKLRRALDEMEALSDSLTTGAAQ